LLLFSELYYRANRTLSYDSILTMIERQVNSDTAVYIQLVNLWFIVVIE
jgi:hypothetical protein